MIRAWHFLYEGHKLRDGRTASADGEWLVHSGPVVACQSGLHASRKPADALQHAPGPILCLVECDGDITHESDKLVCRRRRIVARMDATEMLRFYARMRALSVVHLWSPPDVVLDYLMTEDESIRAAAKAAAWDAARDAARDAAKAAAWDAARDAARDAAKAAAWAAAKAAAWAAARDEARDAAWDAARDAAWDAARDDFDSLVFECFEQHMVTQ
jgi:hypothetical protein